MFLIVVKISFSPFFSLISIDLSFFSKCWCRKKQIRAPQSSSFDLISLVDPLTAELYSEENFSKTLKTVERCKEKK